DRHLFTRLADVVAEEHAGREIDAMASRHHHVWSDEGSGAAPLRVVADGDAIEEIRTLHRNATYDALPAQRSLRELSRVLEIARIFEDFGSTRRRVRGDHGQASA